MLACSRPRPIGLLLSCTNLRSVVQVNLDFLSPKQTCNCKSTNCLKLYCVCFASGALSRYAADLVLVADHASTLPPLLLLLPSVCIERPSLALLIAASSRGME